MADEYIPNINATYTSKIEFLEGENIPKEFWDYFEDYDPAREQLMMDQADQMEGEQALAMRKARFQLNNQKRQLLSQTGKMGFASSGEMTQGMENLVSMWQAENYLVSDSNELANRDMQLKIDDVQREWLDAQFATAASLAPEIEDANRTAAELVTDINNADSHWERSHLDDYKQSEDKRRFLNYMDDQGKSNWEQWKKPQWTDKKELRKQYNKDKHSGYTSPRKG